MYISRYIVGSYVWQTYHVRMYTRHILRSIYYLSTYVCIGTSRWILSKDYWNFLFMLIQPKERKNKPQILKNFTQFLTNYVARGNFGEFNACELRRFWVFARWRNTCTMGSEIFRSQIEILPIILQLF